MCFYWIYYYYYYYYYNKGIAKQADRVNFVNAKISP